MILELDTQTRLLNLLFHMKQENCSSLKTSFAMYLKYTRLLNKLHLHNEVHAIVL